MAPPAQRPSVAEQLLADALTYRSELAEKLARATLVENGLMASALATKSSMPEHYWQPRFMLEKKMAACTAFIMALTEG